MASEWVPLLVTEHPALSSSPLQHKIPRSVLVVIHTPSLLVLLLERAPWPGYWQSVTGSVERADEPLRETAIREVAEETGLAAERYASSTGASRTPTRSIANGDPVTRPG